MPPPNLKGFGLNLWLVRRPQKNLCGCGGNEDDHHKSIVAARHPPRATMTHSHLKMCAETATELAKAPLCLAKPRPSLATEGRGNVRGRGGAYRRADTEIMKKNKQTNQKTTGSRLQTAYCKEANKLWLWLILLRKGHLILLRVALTVKRECREPQASHLVRPLFQLRIDPVSV